MDELDSFISNILDEKQLSGVTEDVRAQLVEDLKNRLLDQVNRALIDAMPDEKIDQFNELLDRNVGDEELQQFVTDSGVNIPAVTTAAMLHFRDAYLGNSPSTSADTNEAPAGE